MGQSVLSSHDVAELVQVSPSAVLRWIAQGRLRAFRTPGGHRRIEARALVEFLRRHQMPVPQALEPTEVRLLVIDDQPAFVPSLGLLLKRADPRIELEAAEGAVDGLLKVGLQRPDAVLLDAYMPGMDGVEVCRRIKSSEETKDIAVIALTGRPSEELERAFRAAGAADFLLKPVGSDGILGALARVGLVVRRQEATR